MNNIKKSVYILKGKNYILSHELTDAGSVYKDLARDLMHKKIDNYKDIKRITKRKTAAAFIDITVYYNNNVKAIYTVEA